MILSVVMPVCNTPEKYLRSAVESILNQTYIDFEFIIVDDGSSSDIAQVINSYNDSRIKYIYQNNTGIVGALNKGFAFATGKYIARMDSDDISLPYRFEKQIKYMEQNPDVGVCGCLVEEFDDNENIVNLFGQFRENPVLSEMLFQTIICHPTAMFRKSILDKFDINYSDDYPFAEDQDMWHKILKHSKIHVIQEPLLRYRRHDNAVSNVNAKKGIQSFNRVRAEILEEIFPTITINESNLNAVINILRVIANDTNNLNRIISLKKTNFIQEIFSLKNSIDAKHKIITILGIKIKIKRNNKIQNNVPDDKIPKTIHYCWFGENPKTKLVQSCIESWKKYLPDYDIREWNDDDLRNCTNTYVQEAYKSKKWAFITDYFRLYALYNYGGIYLDSDNEVFKSFDKFLDLDFFSGYENYKGMVSPFTAVVGAKKGNKIVKDLLDEYSNLHFIKENGELDLYTNTARVTRYFQRKYNFLPPYDEKCKKFLEEKSIIFPSNIFCNYQTNISYAVHHFNGSWLNRGKKAAPNSKSLYKRTKNFIKQIFSVRNEYSKNNENHKVITVFGMKIKLKTAKTRTVAERG